MYSKRLTRQLNKTIGVDPVSSLADAQALSELPNFLKMIDEAYLQLEEKAQLATRSLEISSEELSEANLRLTKVNISFDAMLNSLGQGFVIFDQNGVCGNVYSKICEELLETNPSGKSILEVLKIPSTKHKTILSWVSLLFNEVTDFDDLVKIGPQRFTHSKGRVVEISFKPVRGFNQKIAAVVLIATDRTEAVLAQERAARTMEHAHLISAILRDRNEFIVFLRYSKSTIGILKSLLSNHTAESDPVSLDLRKIKFELHTLKGSSASFGFYSLQRVVHEAESALLDAHPNQVYGILEKYINEISNTYDSYLRSNKELFDGVLAFTGPIREVPVHALVEFYNELTQKNFIDLPTKFAEKFIEIPAEKVFSRFSSILEETCIRTEKRVPHFTVIGNGVKVFPEAIERVLRGLVHVFRNIAVHGIENDEERNLAKKEMVSTVKVEIHRINWNSFPEALSIEISDDGRGLSFEKIRNWLTSVGRENEAKSLNETDLAQIIFENGFSTHGNPDEYAGRGVGLGALKEDVVAVGGEIKVVSVPGKGMTTLILIPDKANAKFSTSSSSAAA